MIVYSFHVSVSNNLSVLVWLGTDLLKFERTDVMDYSLVVGVDSVKGELVVGIVGKSTSFLDYSDICISTHYVL